MILLIDNYDSFTYNLVQRLGEIDSRLEIEVYRNDKISVDEIEAKRPSHLIISPGPARPAKPVFRSSASAGWPESCRSSAFAWAISPSARPPVPRSCGPSS